MSATASPIRRARADAFASLVDGPYFRGKVRLTAAAYDYLAALGLNRACVGAAVDELARRGRVSVIVEHGVVVVRSKR